MQHTDLRPFLAQAQDWVAGLIDGVRPDQLDRPTPCPEFDVRALVGHLYTGAGRVRRIGEGSDPMVEPHVVTDLPDDLAGGYRDRIRAARAAWADDATLTRTVRVPWGEVPGVLALGGYLTETLTHGWDLARATGQPSEAAPELAERALVAARHAVPEEPRGGHIPFGPPVAAASDAGPTERLANWLGRSARPAE